MIHGLVLLGKRGGGGGGGGSVLRLLVGCFFGRPSP